jgi:hypothetical protein
MALVIAPTTVCSSDALLTDLRLLADATRTSSKEASAASSSSIDTTSSSVLASATAPSSPEEASEAVVSSSELTSAATVSSLEIASAASISASSSSISSAAAPEEPVLSLEDDELSKFSCTRRRESVRMLSLLKVKCHSSKRTGITSGTRLSMSALCLDCHETKNYVNIMGKVY